MGSASHEEAHRLDLYYHRCVALGPWFIKYGDHATLEPEYKTQEYLFSKAVGDPSAPRIPQVVAYFTPAAVGVLSHRAHR